MVQGGDKLWSLASSPSQWSSKVSHLIWWINPHYCCCYFYYTDVTRSFRRDTANKALNTTGQDHINMDTLFQASVDQSSCDISRKFILYILSVGDDVWIGNRLLSSRFYRCIQCVTGKKEVIWLLFSHYLLKESHDCSCCWDGSVFCIPVSLPLAPPSAIMSIGFCLTPYFTI